MKEILNAVKKGTERLKVEAPLIHCITSPIAINDCANSLLAVGARPIMAEHPMEVEEITEHAAALGVSLANISDSRMEAILLAGKKAEQKGIPSVIDVVGVSCSALRMKFANRWIRACKPSVVKGNASEIRALSGASFGNFGIDVAPEDEVCFEKSGSVEEMGKLVSQLAAQFQTVVLSSGQVDILSDGIRCVAIENGKAELGKITGTGCILNCLTAAYLSVSAPFYAALSALMMLEVSGERADETGGLGSYHIRLIDELSQMNADDLVKCAKVTRLSV